MDFENMIERTQKVLEKNRSNECAATALLTDQDNLYIICCNTFANCSHCDEKPDEDYSLKDLIAAGDNRILKMVTIFKTTGIDFPCAWLRQSIYNMNNENKNTEVKCGSGTVGLVSDF